MSYRLPATHAPQKPDSQPAVQFNLRPPPPQTSLPCNHRHLREALGSEKEFIRLYGPRFRFILEAVSDATYKERGVTESQVAVTLHK